MGTFDEFLKILETDLLEFAENTWNTYKTEALQDGNAFVHKYKVDLERWTKLLASGDLTRDDFEWLVKGKKDLAELLALKHAGLAKVVLDSFRTDLISTIVSTAFKVFL